MLRVCDMGLSGDASRALRSMLKIVQGRAEAAWEISDIDHAHVLIAHFSSDPAALNTWTLTGKPIVLIVDEVSQRAPSRFVLKHPFRVMQLIQVLDDVALHLQSQATEAPIDTSEWAPVQSLRRMMTVTDESGWHLAHGQNPGDGQVLIGNGHAFASPAMLLRLRQRQFSMTSFCPTPDSPANDMQRIAVNDMAWLLGLTTPLGLAPWLADDEHYRLRRWPDFGRLGASMDLIELSAIAAAKAHTPVSLASVSGHTAHGVHRFLAAASLAGLLSTQADTPALAPVAAPPRARGWMRFVGDLRRHLRLEA